MVLQNGSLDRAPIQLFLAKNLEETRCRNILVHNICNLAFLMYSGLSFQKSCHFFPPPSSWRKNTNPDLVGEVAGEAEAAEAYRARIETCLGSDDRTPHFLQTLVLVQPSQHHLVNMAKRTEKQKNKMLLRKMDDTEINQVGRKLRNNHTTPKMCLLHGENSQGFYEPHSIIDIYQGAMYQS